MTGVRKLIWNDRENRLRAGWRILLQFALNIGLILLLETMAEAAFKTILPSNVRGFVLAYPVMFAATMIAVRLAGRFFDRRRFADFGLSPLARAWQADFAFGAAWAAAPVLILLAAFRAAGWIAIDGVFESKWAGAPVALAFAAALIVHLCVGAFEETARIYQMRNLLEGLRARFGLAGAALAAAGAAALISAGMHAPELEYLPPVYLAYVLLDGMFLGLCWLLTGRAAVAIAMHAMVDLLLLTVFVPGGTALSDGFVTLFGVRFMQTDSAALASAGMSGAALIGLLAYESLNVLGLYAWVKIRYGKFSILENLAIPTPLAESDSGR